MKKQIKFIAFTLFAATVFMYTACEKQQQTDLTPTNESVALPEFSHTKSVVLKDAEGKTAATLKISAVSQTLLDQYTEKSFTLKPVFEEEPASGNPAPASNLQTITSAADAGMAEVNQTFIVTDYQLPDGAIGFELTLAESQSTPVVDDRDWTTSVIWGNSCAHRMKITNTGPTIFVHRYHSPWCVNSWYYQVTYSQTTGYANYCNQAGGIAAQITYQTPKRWSMTMYTNCQ